MEYVVTGFTNFCRVFELPDSYPSEHCFGEGHIVHFRMVDWFKPIQGLPNWAISEEKYNELVEKGELNGEGNITIVNGDKIASDLKKFLSQKIYIKNKKQYLVICKFGFSFMFTCIKP